MIDPFLAGIPAPEVIEELSFEAILERMKTDLSVSFPEISPVLALESSAAVKVMQVAAYREMLLRARINDAARANLLAFAQGGDLDHVGANASPPVERMFGEDDDRFRNRILLAVRSRNTGSVYRYEFVALTADIRVANAIAYRNGRDPTVHVAILAASPTGDAPEDLLAVVRAAFAKPENRMVNGPVTVLAAVGSVVNLTASLTITPGTPETIMHAAQAALRAAWASEGGLGRDLTLDWIRSRLMVPGVYSVAITLPAADIIVPPHQAAAIGGIELSIAAENE